MTYFVGLRSTSEGRLHKSPERFSNDLFVNYVETTVRTKDVKSTFNGRLNVNERP